MKKIYVGNLSFKTTEVELRGLFAAHGQVDSVSLITEQGTGRPRGFAFVEMGNDGEAEKAIAALNGMDVGGRQLNVNEARPQRDRGERGGRRGGFGGGGRSDGGRDHGGHARKPREPRW
ncbi:MAG: RNA recognition motif domain-containing protein [Terriglobales bacterium]